MRVHATCIALGGSGVLIRGPSGSGKSDLALRLIDDGAALVADDQVDVRAAAGALVAAAPETIAGLIEVRGVGIVRVPQTGPVPVALVVDLVGREAVERLPGPVSATIEGVDLPRIALCPFEASAPAKVRLALGRGRDARAAAL